MEKAQARYKRAVDKRVQARRKALRVGDWVFVKSHENQGGKIVFKTLGPYQILKTDGCRLTIESDDGIRTINRNHATRAPEPPEGDPAWERAPAAWQVPSLPSSARKPIEAVFDDFVGQGYDEHERIMLRVWWFGYGPREDSWHYVEDPSAAKVRKHCTRHRLTVRRRASNKFPLGQGTPHTHPTKETTHPPTTGPSKQEQTTGRPLATRGERQTQLGTDRKGGAGPTKLGCPPPHARPRAANPGPGTAGGRRGRTLRSGREREGRRGTRGPAPGPWGPAPTSSAAPYSAPPPLRSNPRRRRCAPAEVPPAEYE